MVQPQETQEGHLVSLDMKGRPIVTAEPGMFRLIYFWMTQGHLPADMEETAHTLVRASPNVFELVRECLTGVPARRTRFRFSLGSRIADLKHQILLEEPVTAAWRLTFMLVGSMFSCFMQKMP